MRIDALEAKGYAVTVDYFRMLIVLFRFGRCLSKAADKEGSNDVVIGDELNQKVFRGANSVGQELDSTVTPIEFRVLAP